MSWTDAHRYYDTLRAIEAELDRRGDGTLAWRTEHAELFGTPERLWDALRSRWETLVQAQVERAHDLDGGPSAALLALALEHRGLVRAVSRGVPAILHSADPDQGLVGAA